LQGASLITGLLPMVRVLDVPLSWPVISTILGNSYLFVMATTLLSLFLAGACLVFKYAPLMLNDMRNITNNDLPDSGLIAWMLFFFAVPLFFNVGPMMLLLWWFLLLWGYMIPSEKRITYFFFFLIIISGWISHVGAGFITYTENHLNRQIYTAEHGLGDDDDILAINSWTRTHTADAEPMNTLAVCEMKRSNYGEAISLLTRSIDLEPNNARYYNHLAIALLGSGKGKEALNAFENAITLTPGTMVYHYNVSRIYQSTYNFYEGEKAIAAASGIDAEGVRNLLDRENALGKTRYILETTPLVRQLSRQMRPSDTLRSAADALWSMAFGLIPRKVSLYFGLGLFVVLIILSYLPEEKFSKQCCRCGKLYYSGTSTKTGNPMCLQCSWIDTRVKKQENNILHHKTEEIRRHKASSYPRLLHLEMALPGLGSFLTHRTGRAMTRIVVLSASLMAIITGGTFIISFIPVDTNIELIIRVMGLVCLGLLVMRAYKAPPIRYGV